MRQVRTAEDEIKEFLKNGEPKRLRNSEGRQLGGRHRIIGIQASFSREESMADTILPKLSEGSTEKGSERTIGSARTIMEKT